jgi:predicted tellurium resistance membrane protein TerC
MAEALEKHETGTSLMFAGLAVWVASLLVAFFLPAAFKIGHHTIFLSIMALLIAVGVVLMAAGSGIRGNAEKGGTE